MNILIIGGGGYLGAELTNQYLKQRIPVTIVDKLIYGQGQQIAPVLMDKNCTFLNVDVMDIPTEVIQQADLIYAMAALVGMPICDKYPEEAQRVNVKSLEWLVPQLREDQKLVYLCSSSGYGSANILCDENTKMESISLYGKTKEEAEKVIMSGKSNATSLRLATVWGQGLCHRFDLLINDLTWQAVKNKTFELFQGDYKRSYVNIKDVINILYSFRYEYRMNGEIYNVSGDNFTKSELVEKIKQFIPDLTVTYSNKEDQDRRSYFLDCTKLTDLGFKMRHTVDNSLPELIKYYNILDSNTNTKVHDNLI